MSHSSVFGSPIKTGTPASGTPVSGSAATSADDEDSKDRENERERDRNRKKKKKKERKMSRTSSPIKLPLKEIRQAEKEESGNSLVCRDFPFVFFSS